MSSNSSSSSHSSHIQDLTTGNLVHYWGYADRVLPCVNDAASCAYLDIVYRMHEIGMIYSYVLWSVVLGVLLVWYLLRIATPRRQSKAGSVDSEASKTQSAPGLFYRLYRTIGTARQRWLLQETPMRWAFGHVSRLQVLVFLIISAYLTIFTFVGAKYQTWTGTPVKGQPGMTQTRSTIGPWSDRIGVIAYAITPLAILLGSRESLLSLITGVPHQHFIFLHRMLGRVIYIQSVLHTIMWTIIEGKLYQPQPKVFKVWISQLYMIWGCVALVFISFIFFFSFRPVIRWTGYEFFRKAHYVTGMLYIGACWGHWPQLYCFMLPGLILWGMDRAVRLLRTFLIHRGMSEGKGIAFKPAQAVMTLYPDEEATVVRLDFEHQHSPWAVGQHLYLTFPELSIWQAHPMTPSSTPVQAETQKHTYIIRAMKGETRKLAELAAKSSDSKSLTTTPVILAGGYGKAVLSNQDINNVLAVAGGTGISFAIPVVMEALERARLTKVGAVELVWVIRHTGNIDWIKAEFAQLRAVLAEGDVDFKIRIFVTRDNRKSQEPSLSASSDEERKDLTEKDGLDEKKELDVVVHRKQEPSTSDLFEVGEGFSIEWLADHHPRLNNGDGTTILDEWLARGSVNGGRNLVVASGPSGMGKDLREIVAAKNDVGKVWKGKSMQDVDFYWDDRFS